MMTGLQSCAGPEVWQMKKIGFRVLASAVLLLGLLLAAPVLAGQKHEGPKHSAHGHSWPARSPTRPREITLALLNGSRFSSANTSSPIRSSAICSPSTSAQTPAPSRMSSTLQMK
jgi:hypothetical protein